MRDAGGKEEEQGFGRWKGSPQRTFSLRMSSALRLTGGSIAKSASTCSRWFCMISAAKHPRAQR
eukprot:8865715-Pyramimonas_sp.AAC.1